MNENDYKQNIAPKAFDMFRDWTKNAQKHYPDLDFTIIDESVLVQNLLNTIRSAKETLLKEEKKIKELCLDTILVLCWALLRVI